MKFYSMHTYYLDVYFISATQSLPFGMMFAFDYGVQLMSHVIMFAAVQQCNSKFLLHHSVCLNQECISMNQYLQLLNNHLIFGLKILRSINKH